MSYRDIQSKPAWKGKTVIACTYPMLQGILIVGTVKLVCKPRTAKYA